MNVRGKRPRYTLPACPRCGMDSGRRVVSDTVPEKCYVVCDTCGYHTAGFTDMSHATKAWVKKTGGNSNGKHYGMD